MRWGVTPADGGRRRKSEAAAGDGVLLDPVADAAAVEAAARVRPALGASDRREVIWNSIEDFIFQNIQICWGWTIMDAL